MMQGVWLDQVRKDELKYLMERHRLLNAGSDREPGSDREEVGQRLVGLALLGDGIRSATTNLGVLQGLSRLGILPRVDCLCTVSGGGYIAGTCARSIPPNNVCIMVLTPVSHALPRLTLQRGRRSRRHDHLESCVRCPQSSWTGSLARL